jgi:hypothetical protein
METEIAWLFFKKFKDDHFSLAYMGEFDDDLTEALMRINETSIEEPQKLKKRLSYLIAECFQNIIRHADKPEIINRTNNKPNIFLLRNVGRAHYIASTNLISNRKMAELESKLKSINTLSAENLKDVYIGALANNEISEKGGGGLGLIEMARRSGFPLEFAFEFVNYFFSIFYIQVRFASLNPEGSDVSGPDKIIPIDETKSLYSLMLSQNIVMVRKGDFSQGSILPLIDLMEGNLKLKSNFSGSKKKMMYLFVELLQNISKHGGLVNGLHEGIFVIAQKDKNYVLTAGNYIDAKNVEPLREKLKNVTDLDKNELMEAYKNSLLKKESGENGNAGIGLIEMAKFSSEKIKYNFVPVDESLSFFSISVTV